MSVAASSPSQRHRLLFPLALVLFEFSVYIANDMAQPAMLKVVDEFSAGVSWVPLAMTAFLLGGALLSWLTGPLSDRIGRRPVLLAGVAYFIVTCLATYLVSSIEAFMVLRVMQGIGLCFINAVGYAAVQEAFEDNKAVQVTALMANVALIAPLVGPLAGAALIEFAPWRSCFLVIAVLALFALIGLWRSMPETVSKTAVREPLSGMAGDYRRLFSDRQFLAGMICMPLLTMPLMGWIALSPVLLVEELGMDMRGYGLSQLPVFAGLIVGNFVLAGMAERWPLGRSVLLGMWPLLGGMLLMWLGLSLDDQPLFYLLAGMSLMAFGEGLSFAVLYRFALMRGQAGKGTVSAAMSMGSMAGYALGIELLRQAYIAGGMAGFAALAVFTSLLFVLVARPQVKGELARRELAAAAV